MTDREAQITELITQTDSGELVVRCWRVHVTRGPDQGNELTRDSGSIAVGAHSSNDLVLTDAAVSRYHAELRLLAEGVLLLDLGSTNGVRVGGKRVSERLLRPGESFRIGTNEVAVEPIDREEPVTPGAAASFGPIETRSPRFARILSQLHRVAPSNVTVLLLGETGTGKELVARALHEHSARASGPFEVIDCGALAPSVLEAELFGHVRGAFTGATQDREGVVEAANGGTVFVDEIGELSLDLQPKLLRVLESRTVRRVGASQERAVDVRFVAATHRNLAELIGSGGFREDLYYRLGVVKVVLPPLRERLEDLPLLLHAIARDLGHSVQFSDGAVRALARYDWPGNVRELRNVVERAVLFCPDGVLDADNLFAAADESSAPEFHLAKQQAIAEFEARYVAGLMARHGDNVSAAAREAGISRNALYALIRRVGTE